MKKIGMIMLAFLNLFSLCAEAKNYEITSPNQDIIVTVSVTDAISYSVKYRNQFLMLPSEISMTLQPTLVVGKNPVVSKVLTKSVNEIINPVVGKRGLQYRIFITRRS